MTPPSSGRRIAGSRAHGKRGWPDTYGQWDNYLDQAAHGPTWLKDARIVEIVKQILTNRDGIDYRLDAFSIMPNHLHLLLRPITQPLSRIMHRIKGLSAHHANKALSRTGPFW